LYALKGREARKPTALLAADVDALLASLPELRGRAETIARTLLPGPYTLILDNPAHRFPWLAGDNTAAIGVRVPALPAAPRPSSRPSAPSPRRARTPPAGRIPACSATSRSRSAPSSAPRSTAESSPARRRRFSTSPAPSRA
jgi:Putative translation factor (SUA5)